LAGFYWPYGPDPVWVRAEAAPERRVQILEPDSGWSLWVDPSLPAPGKEGPLGVEAAALREAAGERPLSHLALTAGGPRMPAPGAGTSRRLATLAALCGQAPLANTDAERAAVSGKPASVGGNDVAIPAETLAWLNARVVLFRERVVESPPSHPPEAEPHLEPSDPQAYWLAVAGTGLDEGDCERARGRLQVLAESGLHANWTLDAIRGRAVHLGLCEPDRREQLEATLREFSFEPLPCTLLGVRGLELREHGGDA
jgi:hypothetical protein